MHAGKCFLYGGSDVQICPNMWLSDAKYMGPKTKRNTGKSWQQQRHEFAADDICVSIRIMLRNSKYAIIIKSITIMDTHHNHRDHH